MTDWLDGPRLVTWLEAHGLTEPSRQLGSCARRIRDWRKGGTANVYAVDRVLTRLGLSLTDLPADLYRGASRWGEGRRPRPLPGSRVWRVPVA